MAFEITKGTIRKAIRVVVYGPEGIGKSTFASQFPGAVFIDTEGAGENARAKDLDVETRTSVCDAFCATIQNAGYTAGVYASRNWYQTMLNTPVLEKYFIWLAEYREVPLYEGYYGMWQHSSKGQINGIKGNVDLDILYE